MAGGDRRGRAGDGVGAGASDDPSPPPSPAAAARADRGGRGAPVLRAAARVAGRLVLGLALIAAASGVLLLSDRRSAGSAAPPWPVSLIEFVNITDVEEAERGLRDGLRDAGLQEGRDFNLRAGNAQGDMAALNTMVDEAVARNSRMLITMSAPSLQAALRRARDRPIVFTYVADPFAAGAGKSDREHDPRVTGVYNQPAVEALVAGIKALLPAAQTLGTLYAPAEVNSVYYNKRLRQVAEREGFAVKSVAINEAAAASDAALAICQQRVDAICPVGGNLTAVTFPSIIQAANKARLPVFGFLTNQAQDGALVTVARDFYDGGHEAGRMAARVIRGESPSAIPFEPVRKTRLLVNLAAARTCGLILPPSLLARADQVFGESAAPRGH